MKEVGNIKGGLFSGKMAEIRGYTPAQRAVFLCAASIFLHYIITCAIVLGTVIWGLCQREIRSSMFHKRGVPALCIFFVLLLVVPFCYGWYMGVFAGIGAIVVLLFFLFSASVMNSESWWKAMDICCTASIVPFFYAIVQKFVFGPEFRSTAGLLNANYYGTVIEFVVLICVWRILQEPEKKNFFIPLIIINVIGVFLCDCQSSWLSIVLSLTVLLFLSRREKAGAVFCTIAAVIIIFGLTVPGILPRLYKMPQTVATRMDIWETALCGIQAHPLFGQGTLSYWFSYARYGGGYETYHSHSLYLDPFLNYGIVGVALFGYFFFRIFQQIYRNFRKPCFRDCSSLAIAATSAVLVHGVTDTTLLWIQTGMLFLLLLAVSGFREDSDSIKTNVLQR